MELQVAQRLWVSDLPNRDSNDIRNYRAKTCPDLHGQFDHSPLKLLYSEITSLDQGSN